MPPPPTPQAVAMPAVRNQTNVPTLFIYNVWYKTKQQRCQNKVHFHCPQGARSVAVAVQSQSTPDKKLTYHSTKMDNGYHYHHYLHFDWIIFDRNIYHNCNRWTNIHRISYSPRRKFHRSLDRRIDFQRWSMIHLLPMQWLERELGV